MFSIDEILQAKATRSDAWAQACSGRITTAELYVVLAALRKRYGAALYDRSAR
jgi:hypothetical protein